MIQEVKIIIHGLHLEGSGQDIPVEVVAAGEMYTKDGALCISYDEVLSEEENGIVQVAKNTLKIRKERVEIVKKGPSASHMVFLPGQTTFSYYSTPYGELEISVHTNQIQKVDSDNGFYLGLEYDLEMNQTYVSSCSVNISVEEV